MLGEAGDDILNGGRDVNYLYGGAGADTFVQNAVTGAGTDVISDFELGTDRIQLIGGSVQTFAQVQANMFYSTVNGFTILQTGAGAAIWLAGDVRTVLTEASFVFTLAGEAADGKAEGYEPPQADAMDMPDLEPTDFGSWFAASGQFELA